MKEYLLVPLEWFNKWKDEAKENVVITDVLQVIETHSTVITKEEN